MKRFLSEGASSSSENSKIALFMEEKGGWSGTLHEKTKDEEKGKFHSIGFIVGKTLSSQKHFRQIDRQMPLQNMLRRTNEHNIERYPELLNATEKLTLTSYNLKRSQRISHKSRDARRERSRI